MLGDAPENPEVILSVNVINSVVTSLICDGSFASALLTSNSACFFMAVATERLIRAISAYLSDSAATPLLDTVITSSSVFVAS